MHLPCAIKCADFVLISIVPCSRKSCFCPQLASSLTGEDMKYQRSGLQKTIVCRCVYSLEIGMQFYHQGSFREEAGFHLGLENTRGGFFLYLEEGKMV